MRLPIGGAAAVVLTCLWPGDGAATCLTDAVDFAQRICREVTKRDKSTLINADKQLTSEGEEIIQQNLSSSGATLQSQADFGAFENILTQQLSDDTIKEQKCGAEIAKVAIDKACSVTPKYKSCRNPSFGLASWDKVETFQGTSGWRGGGYNPSAFCSDFINSVVASRGLTNQSYAIESMQPGEEQRRKGVFNSISEYNYHCSVTLRWQPIYNEKIDPLCGLQ